MSEGGIIHAFDSCVSTRVRLLMAPLRTPRSLANKGVTRESKNLENNIKEGWLSKYAVSAPTVLKNWKRRYIVVLPGLIVWCDKPGAGLVDSKTMPVKKGTIVTVKDKEVSTRIPNGTELKLRAMDNKIAEEWKVAILKAIEQADQVDESERPPEEDETAESPRNPCAEAPPAPPLPSTC